MCGGLVAEPPHLSDWVDLPELPNPIAQLPAYEQARRWYIDPADSVVRTAVKNPFRDLDTGLYVRAGPREEVVFRPDEVKAAIVTCGGLCPGLNTVIREVVHCLVRQYGVPESHVFGVEGGYRGFYARNLTGLDLKAVEGIHNRGGTMLGTSRGGHDTKKIVDAIEDRGLNMIFIIGGDGTQRGADAIYSEVRARPQGVCDRHSEDHRQRRVRHRQVVRL